MDPDPDPTPDLTPFFSDFEYARKFFSSFFLITYPQARYLLSILCSSLICKQFFQSAKHFYEKKGRIRSWIPDPYL
jgi:hypothetical protein